MSAQRRQTQLRLGELQEPVDARTHEGGSDGKTVYVMVERYLWMLQRSMPRLTEAEASLICDALNGIWMADTYALPLIWAGVSDACRLNDLGGKWGLDEQQQTALIKRMQGWNTAELLAVIDGVERFWRDHEATVQSVGMVRE